MHIVYLIERIDIKGGIERSLTVRVNYLIKKYNYNITLICTEKKTGIPAYKLNPLVNIIFLENLTSKQTVYGRVLLRLKQTKVILNLNPEIIISTKYTLHNVFFRTLRTKAKLISELRETKENYNLNRNNSLKSRLNTYIRDYIFRKQNLLIVLTNADKKNWGFDNIKVIPNPKTIESNIVSPLTNKQVLAVGRLETVKGFDKLIDVWYIVTKKHPNWKLKICGEGSEYSNLIKKVELLNIEDHITITNKSIPIIPEFLNSSIFVLTSQFESFGNVMVEAKVCGVPIVAFDAPNGPREIIIDNKDGFLIELNNIDSMANKINYLIENPNIIKKMGIIGKVNSNKYDVETIVEYYNKIIIG